MMPYFLSHAAAMELHRMVTQFVIFVSSVKRIPSQTLHGTQFRFVLLKSEVFFALQNTGSAKQESIETSDLERTILDGLRHPEYCGGITDVGQRPLDASRRSVAGPKRFFKAHNWRQNP
jgi:predicted transcriptional regulator of viral defense system